MKVVTNRNCLYQTAYHVIWCPKYRHDVLTGEVAAEVNNLLDAVCRERRWPVIAKDIQPDFSASRQRPLWPMRLRSSKA